MSPSRSIRARLAQEGGFTLAISMGIMLVASIVCVAAFQAANGDLVPSRENSDRKTAYAAAEAGISFYLSKLGSDPDYWKKCDTGTTNGVADPVNQPTATTRRWQNVSGTGPNVADFNVTLLPVAATCNTADGTSMINTADGSFRIRSTGRYRGELRSIVVDFRQQRFLDYIYFTDYETLDPDIQNNSSCRGYRALRPSSCTVIQFAGNDRVNGPLHTNDDLVYCGTPVFGRTAADNIHVSGPSPGYARNSSCGTSGTPDFSGTFRFGQRQLQMPPSNAELESLTTNGTSGAGYRLTGTQYIRFLGNGQMVLDTPTTNPVTVPVPSNGVIFVANGTCTPSGDPQQTTYADSSGCGNVYVSGTVNRSVTIAAQKDIIVAPTLSYTGTNSSSQFNPQTATGSDANLIASGTYNSTTHQLTSSVQIGLIADGFVRVYHRVSGFPNPGSGASLSSGVRDVRIDAAILSLGHSFIVDNWGYAPSPGDLVVNGAIAQAFRGPVGTGSGATITTGYVKDYWYDDRLRYSSPPSFLNPVDAAWGIGRQSELVPPV